MSLSWCCLCSPPPVITPAIVYRMLAAPAGFYCNKVCSFHRGGRSGQKPGVEKSSAVIPAAAGTPPCLSGQQRMIHQNSLGIHAPQLRLFSSGRKNEVLMLISHVPCLIVLGGIIPDLIVVVLFGFESTSFIVIWVSVADRADDVRSSLNIVNIFFCFVLYF